MKRLVVAIDIGAHRQLRFILCRIEELSDALAILERIGAAYVTVDAPRSETARNLVPTVVAATSPTAYLRFHGRNLATWNKRGGSAAERFDHLYSDGELAEWVEPLRGLAEQAEEVYALMNNNRYDYAPRSGQILRGLLDEPS